jgi:hypothetical protein
MSNISVSLNFVHEVKAAKRTYVVDLHDFLSRKPISASSPNEPTGITLTLNGWLLTMVYDSVDPDNDGINNITINFTYDDVVALA